MDAVVGICGLGEVYGGADQAAAATANLAVTVR
jgi:hypothetical protein